METVLLLYAEQNPEDALDVGRVLEFRRRVAEEFERLALESGAARQNSEISICR